MQMITEERFALINRLSNSTTGQTTTENIMGLFTIHGSKSKFISFSLCMTDIKLCVHVTGTKTLSLL